MSEGAARRPRVSSTVSEGAAGGGGAAAAELPQVSESGLNLFSVMEDINDRLKLLDYESAFLKPKAASLALKPISRLHFALPGPASELFPYFAHLCTWLFSLCHRELLEWNEFDDPNSIASTLVDHLRRIGCPHDFPASRLRPGTGEAVLLILDYMSQLALQQSGFTVLTPVYGTSDPSPPAPQGQGAGGVGGAGEGADEDEDAVQDTVEDEAVLDDDDSSLTTLNDPFSSLATAAPLPPPPPATDPSLWALEYEQVAPLLRAHAQGAVGQEWRGHYEAALKHKELLGAGVDGVRAELERLGGQLRGVVERVAAKEKWLNKEYETLVGEMRGMQGEHEKLSTECAAQSEDLSQMGRRLKVAGEEVERMKELIGRKNERMQDTQPVRAVTAACKELKKELMEMEVRIGIMSQSVSAIRQRRVRDKERQKGKEERERGRKGNGKSQVHVRMDSGKPPIRY